MSDQIIPGAYIIRSKLTPKVLHTDKVYFDDRSRVLAYTQEAKYGNQQIWWIEPLPNYAGEPAYSITNPASGRALYVNPGEVPKHGYQICAGDPGGEAWHQWRIKNVNGDDGEAYFAITSVFNGHVITIEVDSGELHSEKYDPGNDRQCWQLVLPVVSFPPGWFQIENSGTGDLLSHTYMCNPPVLRPPPHSQRPSQYRESWEFQWTLAHSWCYDMSVGAYINSWRIINRLTRAPLSPRFEAQTPQTLIDHNRDLDWELELDSAYNWKIRNHLNSCFLRRSGTAVACDERKFSIAGGCKSWILRPMRPVVDTSPPGYETLAK